MNSISCALVAATVVAVKLEDAEYDTVFAPVQKSHYMKVEDFDAFHAFADNEMSEHKTSGLGETVVTNDAMQALVDFYVEQSATNSFDNFLIEMGDLTDSMENDLRVWWGNHADQSESEDEIPTEIVEKQKTTVNVYNGSTCTNPDFLLKSLMQPMEDRFHFSDYTDTWANAYAACEQLGMGFASIHDAEENTYVNSQVGENFAWIGYNDLVGEKEYTWVDGTCSSYTNWYPGEPNNSGGEDCTHLFGTKYGG